MRVGADIKGNGPSLAFALLESKLPSLKGRKFHASYRMFTNGDEEYYGCVARIDGDDLEGMHPESGLIPRGRKTDLANAPLVSSATNRA